MSGWTYLAMFVGFCWFLFLLRFFAILTFRSLWVSLLLLVLVLLCPLLSRTQVPGLSSAFGFDRYDNIACGTAQGDLKLATWRCAMPLKILPCMSELQTTMKHIKTYWIVCLREANKTRLTLHPLNPIGSYKASDCCVSFTRTFTPKECYRSWTSEGYWRIGLRHEMTPKHIHTA